MSYHGTHVVVIEIPEGSWEAGGQTIDTEKISAMRYEFGCHIEKPAAK